MLDSSFWDSVLGTATTHLGNLFEDIGLGSPKIAPSLEGLGQQDAPDYGIGSSSPMDIDYRGAQENPFMQMFGNALPVPGQNKIFRRSAIQAERVREAAGPTGSAVAGGPLYGGQFSYETPFQVDPSRQQYVDMARAAAKAMGIDEDVFVRQISVESKFDPNAVSHMGAKGLGQLMDPTARELGVTNPFDPESNLNGAARYLKQQLDRYQGDYTKALAAYNAGAGNLDSWGGVPRGEAAVYVNKVLAGSKRREAQQANAGAPGAPQGEKPLKGLTVAQYGPEGLATGAADYICGPIAAAAFVAASGGKQPSLEEALNMARRTGVIDENGMHGIESTASLIRSLGAKATAGAANPREIIGEIMAGRPVILDTPGHYFFIEDYDPATGKFDLGNSAKALRKSGGNSWYTLGEITGLGFGAVRGAIYAR